MVVHLSDGERGGERHFVGKAEAETGEGDAQLLLVSARAKAGIMAAIIITFLIFIILYFMLFLILIEKIPEGRCCFYLLE